MTPPSILLRQKNHWADCSGEKDIWQCLGAEEEQSGGPTMYLRAHSRNALVYGGGQKGQGEEGVSQYISEKLERAQV